MVVCHEHATHEALVYAVKLYAKERDIAREKVERLLTTPIKEL